MLNNPPVYIKGKKSVFLCRQLAILAVSTIVACAIAVQNTKSHENAQLNKHTKRDATSESGIPLFMHLPIRFLFDDILKRGFSITHD